MDIEKIVDEILMFGSILLLTAGAVTSLWANIRYREEDHVRLRLYIMSLAFLLSGGIIVGPMFYQQLENDNKTEEEIYSEATDYPFEESLTLKDKTQEKGE